MAAYPHSEILAIYEKLVARIPDLERKGKSMPYTAVNGNMFSFLDAQGTLSIRLSKEDLADFIQSHKTKQSEQHGRIMKEYAIVPKALLKKEKTLLKYFQSSYEYAQGLKPKKSKKK